MDFQEQLELLPDFRLHLDCRLDDPALAAVVEADMVEADLAAGNQQRPRVGMAKEGVPALQDAAQFGAQRGDPLGGGPVQAEGKINELPDVPSVSGLHGDDGDGIDSGSGRGGVVGLAVHGGS